MKLRSALSGLLALTLVLSCKGGDGGVAGVLVVSSVDVQPGISDVVLGQTRQLAATPKTSSGITVPGRSVAWSSNDPLIASVSGLGLVSGAALGGPVRIRATVDGVVGDALVTVRPVPVDRVTVTPASSPVLVAGSVQLTATAFDAGGAQLSGRSFLWESSAPAIAAVTTTGIVIGLSQGGPVTISAISEGKTGTATVSVSTRPATRLAFAQQPGASIAGLALTPPIRIALQDDLLTTVIGAGNPVTIALAGNPGNATLGGTATLDGINGIATFSNLTLNRVGTGYTFLVTSPGLAPATSTPFNVAAGAANQLAFTTPLPGSAQSGVAFSPQPVLQLLDAVGNPVAQGDVVITVTIASGAGALGGTTSATTNAAGVATFSNLSLSGAAGSYTLSFGAPGITSLVSGPVTLGSGAVASLAIVAQPTSSAQSGVPLSQQPSVQLKDGSGNNVAQAGIVISAAIASGGGALGGATSATTNAGGLAQFTSLAINGPSGTYTLGFSSPGVTGATSTPIILGAGAPTQLAIITQPSSAASSGVAFAQQPVVQLRDGGNNPVAAAGIQVTGSITGESGALQGTATVTTNASGNAVFTNLAISGSVGGYTLTFTSSGLTPVVSGTITLSAGPAAQLGLATQPSAAAASGVAFAQQPVVQIRDAAGNSVAQGGVLVTVTIASGPGGGTLGGTTTATTGGFGAATFSNLSITGPSGTYMLQFTAPGLSPGTSSGVTLGAGAASTIAANSAVSQSAGVGTAVSAPPSVKVTDASNNPVAGVVVTFAVTSGGGTVVPASPATVITNAAGIATATSWTLGPTAGTNNNTVTATASGLAGSPVTFTASGTAGSATTIAANSVTTQSAAIGTAVAAPPSVKVTDTNGNAVAGVAVVFTLTGGGGTLNPASPATVNTNASGVATLTSWTLGTTAGANTVTAGSGSLAGSPVTFNATGTAGGATTIAANSVTAQSATAGTAVAASPSVKVTDASGNGVPGVAVVFTRTAGAGTLNPASPATINTNASGIATLTSWTLGTTAGANTVTATSGSLAGSPVTFNATGTAGSATTITANSVTSQSTTVGTAVTAPPSAKVTDVNGNAVSGTAVIFTLTAGGGTLSPPTPATVNTNASGIATLTSWTVGPTAGTNNNTVTATATGLSGSPVTFTASGVAGTGNKIAIAIQPSSTAVNRVNFAQAPVVQLTDNLGNPVGLAGVQITVLVSTGPAATLTPTTATTDVNGQASFSPFSMAGVVGTRTLFFAAAGYASSPASSNIVLSAGAAANIASNSVISQSATVGTAVSAPPSVKVTDADGNAVSGVAVVFTMTGGGGTLSPASPASVTTNGLGIATLTSWTLGTTAGANTVTATSGSLAGSPVTFNATGTAGATTIAANSVTTQSAAVSTAVAAPPSVKVTDTGTNPIAGVAVTFAVTAGGGTVVPAGPATVTTNASGIATATSWTLGSTAGTNNNTVTATAAGLTGSPVTFTASGTTGGTAQLTYNTQPSISAASGAPFAQQPALLLRDAGNNPVGSALVTATITGAPAGMSLIGTVTATTNGSGVATFVGLGLTGPIGNYTLTFTANGGALSSAASNSIALSAGAAATIAANSVTTQSATVSTAVAAPPSVKVTDTGTNPIAGVAVTFAVTAGGGTVVPAGPATVTTNASGIATATSWTLGATAGTNNNTVTATAAGLTGSPVTFTASGTAGSPTQLTYFTQPSANATNGVAFPTQPVLRVQDAGNNNVSGAVVTATITGSPPGVSLIGTVTATTIANGRATFSGLGLTGPIGNYTLTFTANGGALSSAASNSIALSAGAAATIAANSVTTQSAAVNTAVAAPPSVKVTDASGNAVSGIAVVFTMTGGGGTLSPASPASVTTNGLGIATLTSWTLGTTAGANTVTASSGSLAGSPVTFTASGTP